MTTDALEVAQQNARPPLIGWRRRLCSRLGAWCDSLLEAHHARIPF